MGRLLISYSHAIFSQRYRDTISALAGITSGLVVLLIPLGWYLGQRLTAPVSRVTDTLYRLGEEAARHSTAYAVTSAVASNALASPNSELARLEHSLNRLQQQLEEKEQLQHQFVAADRLAAIGRMTYRKVCDLWGELIRCPAHARARRLQRVSLVPAANSTRIGGRITECVFPALCPFSSSLQLHSFPRAAIPKPPPRLQPTTRLPCRRRFLPTRPAPQRLWRLPRHLRLPRLSQRQPNRDQPCTH